MICRVNIHLFHKFIIITTDNYYRNAYFEILKAFTSFSTLI